MFELLRRWAPFKIDALGLVTMLGSAEVDMATGSLVFNRYAEYLPLLGAFTVASNVIVKAIPGFSLYNITDGVYATDLSGWFARWLLVQEFKTFNSTTLLWSSSNHRQKYIYLSQIISITIFFSICTPLCFIAIACRDWWALGNWAALVISILVRWFVTKENRDFIDKAACEDTTNRNQLVTLLCVFPDGKAVTCYAPRNIVFNCFLTTPRPAHSKLYTAARVVGWVAFSCHVICIGMAELLSQILTVAVLVGATVFMIYGVGAEHKNIGSRLCVSRVVHPGSDRRTAMYVRMDLTPTEERSMLAWSLFPHESNTVWWDKYRDAQAAAKLEKETLAATA